MNKLSKNNIEFIRTLKDKQININSFIKDLKDFYYDVRSMYPDPNLTAARTSVRLNRQNTSKDDIQKKINSELQKYHNRYPHLINTSMLILTISLFESHLCDLSRICQIYSKNEKREFSKDKVEIVRLKKEIEYFGNINLTPCRISWNEISFYRELRNCIVHHNSNLKKMSNAKLENKLINHTDILITRNGNIRFKKNDYMEKVINLIYAYLENILINLGSGKLVAVSIITDKEIRIREWEEKLS